VKLEKEKVRQGSCRSRQKIMKVGISSWEGEVPALLLDRLHNIKLHKYSNINADINEKIVDWTEMD
jgi:hypothetical protein